MQPSLLVDLAAPSIVRDIFSGILNLWWFMHNKQLQDIRRFDPLSMAGWYRANLWGTSGAVEKFWANKQMQRIIETAWRSFLDVSTNHVLFCYWMPSICRLVNLQSFVKNKCGVWGGWWFWSPKPFHGDSGWFEATSLADRLRGILPKVCWIKKRKHG